MAFFRSATLAAAALSTIPFALSCSLAFSTDSVQCETDAQCEAQASHQADAETAAARTALTHQRQVFAGISFARHATTDARFRVHTSDRTNSHILHTAVRKLH